MKLVRFAAAAVIARGAGVLVALCGGPAFADSPLSSTDVATPYNDLAIVRDTRTSRELDADAVKLLLAAGASDHKAAVINALGWGGDAVERAMPFVHGLAAARGISPEDLEIEHLKAADRFVLGYLLAMGEEPRPLRPGAAGLWGATPRELLDQAALALPGDFTVHLVRGLVEGQDLLSKSWCGVYMATRQVLDRFPPARRNMRAKAVGSVEAYMSLYKKDCAQEAAPAAPGAALPAKLAPEANQIYALARMGSSIVAATQWGAVVWDPDQPAVTAARREELCTSVAVWNDAAWFGCEARVVRWDGASWKSFLHEPARDGVGYEVVVHPRSGVLARYGSRVHAYDDAREGFVASEVSLGRNAHTATVRRNGDVWWVEFMQAVHGPAETYPAGSPELPGTDPRAVVEDAAGDLWVVDFGSGLYRQQGPGGPFVKAPGVDEKGSGVAADPARARVWLLHYTTGPVLLAGDAAPRSFDTSDLEFMRDLMVDADGSLWIAGWNKLLRLRDTPQGWKRDELVAR
jgi:hypothetical protein